MMQAVRSFVHHRRFVRGVVPSSPVRRRWAGGGSSAARSIPAGGFGHGLPCSETDHDVAKVAPGFVAPARAGRSANRQQRSRAVGECDAQR